MLKFTILLALLAAGVGSCCCNTVHNTHGAPTEAGSLPSWLSRLLWFGDNKKQLEARDNGTTIVKPPSGLKVGSGCSDNYDFDYMRLALQWTPGVCQSGAEQNCDRSVDYFTIHGLWLNKRRGGHPQGCCFENHFDESALASIHDDLDKLWISVKGKSGSENKRFWSHEWLKHGTCAREVPMLKGELAYFSKSLELFKRFELDKRFREANIVPSRVNHYASEDLLKVLVQASGGKQVNLGCRRSRHGAFDQEESLVNTVSYCFDRDFNFIDCPPFKDSCPAQVLLTST